MQKRYYRDLVEKEVAKLTESLSDDIQDLVKDDIIDELESDVNEVKELLTDAYSLEVEDFDDVKSKINDALSILDELSSKLY